MSAFRSKVLVVGMDGLRFDRLLALDAPVLAGLRSTGAYGTSRLPYGEAGTPRTESPGEVVPKTPEPGDGGRVIRSRTDSGPGWSSIATGAWPDKHGVVDNGFGSPQFQKFPDFLTRAKRARPGLTTSAFFSWAALAEHGAFGPAIDHRFVLDGYAVGWATADKQVAEAAERHLAEDDSDAIFVYLGDTDEVAHDLGPHCPEYAAALQTQDAYLGRPPRHDPRPPLVPGRALDGAGHDRPRPRGRGRARRHLGRGAHGLRDRRPPGRGPRRAPARRAPAGGRGADGAGRARRADRPGLGPGRRPAGPLIHQVLNFCLDRGTLGDRTLNGRSTHHEDGPGLLRDRRGNARRGRRQGGQPRRADQGRPAGAAGLGAHHGRLPAGRAGPAHRG
ncbi:alkaline phosphatase family protein [Nonomuraea rubra]|uniref:alkaline phosphatase family protein n=1 Tax=Nonomuraea rubra TaxID=46180 RepID=UPI0031E94AAA